VAASRYDHYQEDRLTFYLTSDDCKDIHPANKPSDFTVDIPGRGLNLEGSWAMALLDISLGSNNDASEGGDIFVMCNICGDSLAGGRSMPVLRRLWAKPAARKAEKYPNACYVPVNTSKPIEAIRIYITRTSNRSITLGTTAVACTVQLMRTS
jgi:hypothetical protein